ncbi:MAG TPA: VOC family protein [Kofleriaceae bacterium]|nr:VOC family protein [Kofleriaceae bacterium]
MASNDGRFVWHEHLTPDPKASIAFYTEVVGWKTEAFGDGGYQMWASAQGPMGGVMALPDEAIKAGGRASWMGHVQVADVDATTARAEKLGGKVCNPPTDIPTVGRFAVVADPQGATISLFKPGGPMPLHDVNQPGEICWNELVTSNREAAIAFYGELLGWKIFDHMDMGPMGKYSIYGVGDVQVGGIMDTPPGAGFPPTWFFYAATSDLDAAASRVKAAGGSIMHGPSDVPGGRIVQLMDPLGAAFALHQQAKKG